MARPGASYTAEIDPENGKPIDRVRFLVGDTDVGSPHLLDAEIEGLLAQFSSPDLAASFAAEAIAAKYASKVDYRGGKVSRSLSQIYDHYMNLSRTLRSRRAARLPPSTNSRSTHLPSHPPARRVR